MRDLLFAVPGDLGTPTGGYEYARRLVEHLPATGIAARVVRLSEGFPDPSAADLDETARALAALPEATPLMIDGLAYGAMPPATIAAAGARAIIALVHHPLGMEEGLQPARAAALLASETAALAAATRVVATSAYTGRLLAERFGVPAERIHLAPPGTEMQRWGGPNKPGRPQSRSDALRPLALATDLLRKQPRGEGGARPFAVSESSFPQGTLHLLAVGAVTPRKGYDILVRALADIPDLPWRATIVGALDRAPGHVTALRRLIEEAGLGSRVTLAGAVPEEELERLWGAADILVSASLFEGYGMVLAEGLARGVPIIMARAGAADETVPDAAALKVPPGDARALAAALREASADPDLRAKLADAAAEAGRHLPGWSDAAMMVAAAVESAIREARP